MCYRYETCSTTSGESSARRIMVVRRLDKKRRNDFETFKIFSVTSQIELKIQDVNKSSFWIMFAVFRFT